MFNFGQSSTTAGNTFGTTTPATSSLFGGGDASKGFQTGATTATQDNKQNVFGGSAFGSSFMFGAKTTAAATSSLFSPATTSSVTTFGASKPLSFDFGSPPNQTVGSPGFGAATQPQQPQQTPQNLSFGASSLQQQQPQLGQQQQLQLGQQQPQLGQQQPQLGQQQPQLGQQQQPQQPTLTFGSPAQTTASTLSFGTPSVLFGKPATTSAFSFSTPTSGFSAPQQAPSATTSTAPQTTQSFFSVASTTATNMGSTPAPATLSFGQSNFGGGFSFGGATSTAAPASSAVPTLTASLTTTATSFPTSIPSATTQQSAFSYGQPSLSFAPAVQSQPTTTTQPSLSLSTSSGFGFAKTTSTTFATTTQPSLGTTAPTLSLGTTTTAQPTLSLGTTASTGLTFPKPTTSAVISSAASTQASIGITSFGKTTATTTMASLTTATTTTAAAPPQAITSISFAQLEENINKWTQELEEQEKTFINQATQLNAWDRLLIANGEKIVELNDAVQTVKNEQQSLEHELGFVLAQQKELEELLAPMEKQLLEDPGDRLRDPEREHMYSLAENLETQLRQMSEDLKEVIEHLNETNRSQDSNDPIVQIGRILNAHMSSMQWIDNSIAQISTKLDQLKATHDTLRRENERSFQKTYN
ncbi:uncharacterized protein Nup62 [Epargyreus clarus]|uniref:uncharacterized protein Nup62 n=1 Tax=Epargyreus clarus TaxID=520877 RepID=UPI003C2DDBB2